jgi:transposase
MMGYQPQCQARLFYSKFNLDQRVRDDHILRKVAKNIDFEFIYEEVQDKYGYNGNVSVPPPVILKIMLLLILYNVRSERELMATIPERLDWLWFLGYDLDDEIPDHSVLSKARARWGVDTFKTFFERIVWQCVEAGLVDGTKLFMDSSLVQADASNNSVVNQDSLKRYLNKSYRILESRLKDEERCSGNDDDEPKSGIANRKHISTTDPDASVVRQGKGGAKLRYKIHRGVDGKNEIITVTEVTPGEVNEAHRLTSLIELHQETTGYTIDTVVADSKYGIVENYLACHDRGVKAHIPDLKKQQENKGLRQGIFPEEAFEYDPATDTYRCPAGQILTRRRHKKKRKAFEYACSLRTCKQCQLQSQCTKSKTTRSVKRHMRQEDLDIMRRQAEAQDSQRDIRTRQHLMERSFASSTRYGFKRTRWRRLWRVQIQEYLTAAVQNLMVLLRNIKEPTPALGMSMVPKESGKKEAFLTLQELFFYFKRAIIRTIRFYFASRLVEVKV